MNELAKTVENLELRLLAFERWLIEQAESAWQSGMVDTAMAEMDAEEYYGGDVERLKREWIREWIEAASEDIVAKMEQVGRKPFDPDDARQVLAKWQIIGDPAILMTQAREELCTALEKTLDHLANAMQVIDDLESTLLTPDRVAAEWAGGDKVEIGYDAPIIGALASALAQWFAEQGGPNYAEMQFSTVDPEVGPLILTVQRKDGKTPHELRAEAERDADRLRAERSALEHHLKHGDMDGDVCLMSECAYHYPDGEDVDND